MKTINKLLRKYGGYVIDATFAILSVIAVIDFFRNGSNHTAAFAVVAVYAFGVIFRVRYVIRRGRERIAEIEKATGKTFLSGTAKRVPRT